MNPRKDYDVFRLGSFYHSFLNELDQFKGPTSLNIPLVDLIKQELKPVLIEIYENGFHTGLDTQMTYRGEGEDLPDIHKIEETDHIKKIEHFLPSFRGDKRAFINQWVQILTDLEFINGQEAGRSKTSAYHMYGRVQPTVTGDYDVFHLDEVYQSFKHELDRIKPSKGNKILVETIKKELNPVLHELYKEGFSIGEERTRCCLERTRNEASRYQIHAARGSSLPHSRNLPTRR